MSFILCLAHYCDMHGPTPLMVTEGHPVSCNQCVDDTTYADRPKTSTSTNVVSTPAINDALRKLTLQASRSSSVPVSERDSQAQNKSLLKASKYPAVPTSPAAASIETPPQSPRKALDNTYEPPNTVNIRRDSSFRRTYDEKVTKRANPCQNCALTLPKRQNSDSITKDSQAAESNPTLRTRTPFARVFGNSGDFSDMSPPSSHPQSQCTSDAEDESPSKSNSHTRPPNQHRPTSSTSRSSTSSRSSLAQHTHYLDYTSAHEPLVPDTYSIVRASCLRTLSFETLPRKPEASQSTSALTSPTASLPPSLSSSANYGPGYITSTPTPQSAAAGGPIFFGDPQAGYTTAYIFRIPDRHARGRKRVYAFIALSTHRERLAMKAFNFLAAAFRDLAAWIQAEAEAEAEREREREEKGSAVAAINAAYGSGGFGGGGPHDSGIGLGSSGSGLGGGHSAEQDRDREGGIASGSSFLTGGGRGSGFMQRMGGSMGPGGFAPKARGLAELAGLPDFFIQLHSRFVRLLLELGVVLGA